MTTHSYSMESLGVNVIKTTALGRPFQLGMLYDCRKDELIPGIRLWNKEQLQQNMCSHSQINTGFNITSSDSIQDKSKLMNVDGGLKLSLLGGLVQVSGAAKYLTDTKTSFKQQRLTLHYHSTSRFEELTVNQLPSENIPDDDNDIATHVVTAILYGADACFVFDREVSSDEDKSTVEGEVKLALEKLKGISVDANVNFSMKDDQKSAVQNFTCTFYGDFQLPSNPTCFEDAMKVFSDLPKLLGENQELAVPLRVWLYPLDKLHSRPSKLQKEISMDLIMKIESVIESLNTAEMKCSDLLKDTPALTFVSFHDKILKMKENCYSYKLRLMKTLGFLLPNIRGNLMKETELNELLQEHDESPFRGSDLTEWLKARERESEIIKSVLRQLKAHGAQVEVNIDAILMDLDVGNLVSYTFTSLNCSDVLLSKQRAYLRPSTKGETNEKSPDSEQKSWLTPEIQKTLRRNLMIFKTLIKSSSCKQDRFIVSSKEMENHPGSCILLYEHGCDEAVSFTPPSQPACPVIEEVKGRSVVLKVPPSCPATVELRLLYKPKEETVWRSEPVLKDQHTVTLTDLREETEYEIKCAALGKLNYTVDSDVIRVSTEQSTRTQAVMEMSAGPDDPEIRILLMGRKGSGKSSSGNTILGKKVHNPKKHESSPEEVTQIEEKQVHVIDCPDLLDPDLNTEKLEMMKEQLLSGCSAGLSSVLLTVPLEKPVENEEEILYFIKCLFGPEVQKYIMILFTHEDDLEAVDETIDEHLQNHADLQRLVTECGGKFHCFNNRSKSDDQKQELLQKIKGMMMENRGKFIMEQMKRSNGKDIGLDFSGGSSADEVSHEHQIPEKKDLRLVLLGKTGCGKSATGNTIIGRNVFKSSVSSDSETKLCRSETRVRMGKEISVIDTPGLYDTEVSEEDVMKEIVKCITCASPGPHAFIIVIKVGRFTEEEKNTVKQLKEVFGEQMEKYTFILFTHKDQLEKENKTIEQYLEKGNPDLKELVDSCGNRFFCLDNEAPGFPQFRDLISRIEKMVEENGGTHFTNDMFERTEKRIQEIQKKKLDEKVKQFEQERKKFTEAEWKKIYQKLVEESRQEAELSFVDRFLSAAVDVAVAFPAAILTGTAKLYDIIEGTNTVEVITVANIVTRKMIKQKMCGIQ